MILGYYCRQRCARSSVGRARSLYLRGRRFESYRAHYLINKKTAIAANPIPHHWDIERCSLNTNKPRSTVNVNEIITHTLPVVDILFCCNRAGNQITEEIA